eukprot:Nitzschia sp. Nitz4//scaffold20_size174350//26374//26769//NITZ4_002082-RA/size174350-processed-gene-0.87-mRNA-1//-1//CDS//3329541749//8491//frame0
MSRSTTSFSLAMLLFCSLLALASSFMITAVPTFLHRIQDSALAAMPNARTTRGIPSKTAMDSALNADWEPLSELDRRIEDGVNYDHSVTLVGRELRQPRAKKQDGIPAVEGIFVGKFTEEDYKRLRSADLI